MLLLLLSTCPSYNSFNTSIKYNAQFILKYQSICTAETKTALNYLFPPIKLKKAIGYLVGKDKVLQSNPESRKKLAHRMFTFNEQNRFEKLSIMVDLEPKLISKVKNWSNARMSLSSFECEFRLNQLETSVPSRLRKIIVWAEKEGCPDTNQIILVLKSVFPTLTIQNMPFFLKGNEKLLNRSWMAKLRLKEVMDQFNAFSLKNVSLHFGHKEVMIPVIKNWEGVFLSTEVSECRQKLNLPTIDYSLLSWISKNCDVDAAGIFLNLDEKIPRINSTVSNFLDPIRQLLEVSVTARGLLENRIMSFNYLDSTKIAVLRSNLTKIDLKKVTNWTSVSLFVEDRECHVIIESLFKNENYNAIFEFEKQKCNDTGNIVDGFLRRLIPAINIMSHKSFFQWPDLMNKSKMGRDLLDERIQEFNSDVREPGVMILKAEEMYASTEGIKTWEFVRLVYFPGYLLMNLKIPQLYNLLAQDKKSTLSLNGREIELINAPNMCRVIAKKLLFYKNLFAGLKKGKQIVNQKQCKFVGEIVFQKFILSPNIKEMNEFFESNMIKWDNEEMISKIKISLFEISKNKDEYVWFDNCDVPCLSLALVNSTCRPLKLKKLSFYDWLHHGGVHTKQRTIRMLRLFSNSTYSISYYASSWNIYYLERFLQDVCTSLNISVIKSGSMFYAVEGTRKTRNIVSLLQESFKIKINGYGYVYNCVFVQFQRIKCYW